MGTAIVTGVARLPQFVLRGLRTEAPSSRHRRASWGKGMGRGMGAGILLPSRLGRRHGGVVSSPSPSGIQDVAPAENGFLVLHTTTTLFSRRFIGYNRTGICLAADGHALLERSACPFPGRHRVHTYENQDGGGSECRIYFRSGCDASSTMDVVNSCTLRPGNRISQLSTVPRMFACINCFCINITECTQ